MVNFIYTVQFFYYFLCNVMKKNPIFMVDLLSNRIQVQKYQVIFVKKWIVKNYCMHYIT